MMPGVWQALLSSFPGITFPTSTLTHSMPCSTTPIRLWYNGSEPFRVLLTISRPKHRGRDAIFLKDGISTSVHEMEVIKMGILKWEIEHLYLCARNGNLCDVSL